MTRISDNFYFDTNVGSPVEVTNSNNAFYIYQNVNSKKESVKDAYFYAESNVFSIIRKNTSYFYADSNIYIYVQGTYYSSPPPTTTYTYTYKIYPRIVGGTITYTPRVSQPFTGSWSEPSTPPPVSPTWNGIQITCITKKF